MKLLILTMAIFSANLSFADSFTVIRDGKEYLCEQRGPVDPGSGVECANKAYSGPFSRDESQALCAGARSTAPADCGILAYSGPFSKVEAIQLCTHARSTGPVECAKKAYSGPFSKAESLDLCAGDTSALNADCAAKAYAGPYSKAEAIKMCKYQPLLVMRSLDLIAQSAELRDTVQRIKSNLK